MKKVIIILLMLCVFLSGDFIQKWFIPYGTIAPGGRILVYDSDHDEKIELIFRRWIAQSFGVYFVEFVPPDSWDIYESIYVDSVLAWDAGDFDNDGYADLITDGDASSGGPPVPIISVYESPDSFSYPTQEVWRDTVGFLLVQPISAYDVDNDGYPEILDNNGDAPNFFWIYESVGNNQYDLIFTDNPDTSNNDAPSSTHGFGDFDSDGKIEFVMGGMSAGSLGATYWIYESPADNTYERIVQGYVSTKNIKDCFSVPDADGDGKLEFVVKGFVIPSAEIHAFIFEAVADNTYEIIKTFTLPGGDYYGGYSAAGDVDGDSIPEIVLEARQNVFIIKSAGNDSFYVWDTLPGHASGSCVRIFDIDDNGLSEIIISGADETRIYEYGPGGMEETALRLLPNALRLEVYPNPFRDKVSIVLRAESKEVTTLGPMPFAPYIKIYDVTGRLVKSFSRSTPDALCSTLITWHGDDENGRAVSDGVYFIRFEDRYSGTVDVRKVLKVR